MKGFVKSGILLMVLLLSATMSFAGARLHKLDIRVVLSKNGDARITETRQMTIDDGGTECYIGLGNMSPSIVKDLTVSDETGRQYENIGAWNVKRNRSEKAGRCGIVEKKRGYELCWGLGDSGERTYITSYTITSLVRGYPDADAIRHVFLDKTVEPKPEYAKVTIESADATQSFTSEDCGVWGFRFKGDMRFEDGKIIAETTEAMNSEAALYVMVKFPKGMMNTIVQDEKETFEQKKQLAFEGSDYGDAIEEPGVWDTILDILKAIGILLALGAGVLGLWLLFKKWFAAYKRKKHEKWTQTVDYFKSVPLEGNLQEANDMLNAFRYGKDPDYKGVVSATILQLINEGAFSVEPVMTETGEMQKRFTVKDLSLEKDLSPLAYKMHEIFKNAAGDNQVLDPKELETFMGDKNNKKLVRSFIDLLCTKRDVSYYKNKKEEMSEVYGFKRFLDDFTLVNERNLSETKLWCDYIVWATLFGNAEQVVKDMKAVNPEFFKMDQVASQLSDGVALPDVDSSFLLITKGLLYERAMQREKNKSYSKKSRGSSSRSSGKGGSSSWGGGGGGFSGGGGGGGIR
jgi:uncharacterized membrane protein YgcG